MKRKIPSISAQMEAEGKNHQRAKTTRRDVCRDYHQFRRLLLIAFWVESFLDLISIFPNLFWRQILEKKKATEHLIRAASLVKDHLSKFPHFRHYRRNGFSTLRQFFFFNVSFLYCYCVLRFRLPCVCWYLRMVHCCCFNSHCFVTNVRYWLIYHWYALKEFN